jgi:hypothetical protein
LTREQEFHRLVQDSNVKDEDRMREMASRLLELETYKKENERDKENTLVLSKGDARTTNDLIEQAKNNLSRIEDLEGQLLSLYYVHQHQKEFEAEEEAEDELRKRELKEQEKKDLEFVKRLESKETKQEQLEQQMIEDDKELDLLLQLPDGGRAKGEWPAISSVKFVVTGQNIFLIFDLFYIFFFF